VSEPTILARLRDLEARITALEAGTATGLSGTDQTIRGSHDRLDSLLGAGNAAPTGDVVTNLNADTVDGIHAATTATANYLLALNADKKLPASITGDADTVDGKHASDLGGASVAVYREHSTTAQATTSTTLADLTGCYRDLELAVGDVVVMFAAFRFAIDAARGAAIKFRSRVGSTYSETQEVGNPYNNSYISVATILTTAIASAGTHRVGAQFAACSADRTVTADDMELVIMVIS